MSAPFVFALPLKPRSASNEWEVTQANLRRTVRSILNAARDWPVEICIACHEEPDLHDLGHGRVRVHILPVPFAEPEDVWGGGRDKARKRRHIAAWLRSSSEHEHVYLAFFDADDLVHREVVSHVAATRHGSYLVDDGYVVDLFSGLVGRRRSGFYRACGSSFVCRFERSELPESWEDTGALFSRFGASPEQRGHPEYGDVAAKIGRPPATFPFPAVAYLANHGESLWRAKSGGLRRFDSPREIVYPGAARRILAEDFGAPDLSRELAGGHRVAHAFLRASLGRLRLRWASA